MFACAMKHSTARTMAATPPWLLLTCLAAAGVLQARAQPDSIGFISIDCGLPGTASYVDDATKLVHVPDAAFTDAGSSHNISAEYMTPLLSRRYHTVRSFPGGAGSAARSCYTLRSLVPGLKYLVRAAFLYGNYDGLRRLPVAFDLYVGVNLWDTVNISSPNIATTLEAIVVVPGDVAQVCLLDTGSGTPFISALDLRPLKSTLYPQVNLTRGLLLHDRWNFGPTDATNLFRYPDDAHDRVWFPWVDTSAWDVISTADRVLNIGDEDLFEAPSKVLQTAVTPRNGTTTIDFSWGRVARPREAAAPGYVAVMHFAELQVVPRNAVREFQVTLNGRLWYPDGITPFYLSAGFAYDMDPLPDSASYNVSINATANSTLPPFINAIEIFSVMSTSNVGTESSDASAIMAIKTQYRVRRNWMGDPCVPNTLAWDGLTCSYTTGPPRITAVNISFSSLDGNISSSFADLKAVQYLDLSHNNLTGPIPDAISELASLKVLDLTNNQLSGSIPPGLLKRVQDGSLNLRYANNSNLCTNAESCQTSKGKSKKVAVYIAVPAVLAVVIGLLATLFFCFLRRKKQGSTANTVNPENETPVSHVPQGDAHAQSSLQLENRRFTYRELETITNKFERVLGRGGFGEVYSGSLADGTQVAVKLRSQTSNQGVKEFLAEAQILTRIHHKNLVSMIGYCKDGQHMALVYEYMSEGTLREQIEGNGSSGRCLTWTQRLRIALESAQGLEYLHKGCNPPLVHRDVKATNILLNEKLEAKIADFGLSKAFHHGSGTQLAVNSLVGTPGYIDPEYYATRNLTTKSDVYSFGIVLLELVSGRPAVVRDPEPTNIADWARRRLARGNIEGVVDARMRGDHDVNGVWKVAEIALRCAAPAPSQRPTMAEVVAQLQECLQLEEPRAGAGGDATGSFYTGTSREPDDSAADGEDIGARPSSSAAFEMERRIGMREPTMDTGPVAR